MDGHIPQLPKKQVQMHRCLPSAEGKKSFELGRRNICPRLTSKMSRQTLAMNSLVLCPKMALLNVQILQTKKHCTKIAAAWEVYFSIIMGKGGPRAEYTHEGQPTTTVYHFGRKQLYLQSGVKVIQEDRPILKPGDSMLQSSRMPFQQERQRQKYRL
jgi:hypothetical protein